MLYVVTYDVGDDGARQRIAKVMEGHGDRVQRSVFECRLGPSGLQRMTQRLRALVPDDPQDSVRVYPQCERCRRQAFGLGRPSIAAGASPFQVFGDGD